MVIDANTLGSDRCAPRKGREAGSVQYQTEQKPGDSTLNNKVDIVENQPNLAWQRW